ncbi:hypothetical protein BABINDRAFT_31244 [Babjeviella inositovora NRRL Y-12698]|uniref:HIG1 domain-containing protein n=1 Tax=Babjeviella inositovora NRRL Y-12698 TaxID=984486 RepID=A0A1E3QY72_9ASCO|nr:uncharacterized protein BABINDRAFT_31244 [Babjeviella inositovora NRRL Y-12698]ODQ82629.1 hypothetical protein BABINDRAFT_31244 [Babjeviella inositovora NRRL Y-12698]
MKLVSQAEADAHWTATAIGAAKGTFVGLAFSTAIFTVGARRWPAIRKLNTSVKAAMWVMPAAALYALGGELASTAFDQKMYQSEQMHEEMLHSHQHWASLTTKEKVITSLSENRYSVLGASWVGSMWGSWVLVNRDPIMTKAQKIVQARMYAQALTIVLLIGTVYLSTYEKDHGMGPKRNSSRVQWERVLAQAEAKAEAKVEAEAAAAATN